MKRLASLITSLAVFATVSGCVHVDMKLPGVLDLRSDGQGVPAAKDLDDRSRDGFDAIMAGNGITQSAAGAFTIEDRQHFAINLIPILNDMASEELALATDKVAVRDLVVGDTLGGVDAGYHVVGMLVGIVPFVGWIASAAINLILPPRTATVSGTRVGGAQ